MIEITEYFKVGDRLDGEDELEMSATELFGDSSALGYLTRDQAIKLTSHLIDLFDIDNIPPSLETKTLDSIKPTLTTNK